MFQIHILRIFLLFHDFLMVSNISALPREPQYIRFCGPKLNINNDFLMNSNVSTIRQSQYEYFSELNHKFYIKTPIIFHKMKSNFLFVYSWAIY